MINTIKGLENIRSIYYITEDGKIISYGNYGQPGLGKRKVLKQYIKTNNYLNVALMNNQHKVKYFRVNRLVAMAFIPNPLNKEYVNHIDENRQNNIVKNLEWVTPKENNMHSLTKLMYVYNLKGELVKTYNYTGECVGDGFNSGHACACARGEEQSHKKYLFSYNPLNENDVAQRLSKAYCDRCHMERKIRSRSK